MSKAGRNDPCPCGSGKKYKKCCLQHTYVRTDREDSIRKKLVQDLLKLFRQYLYKDAYEDAFFTFWGEFDPSEYLKGHALQSADINFWEWVIHDWVDDERGKTLIDIYIDKRKVLSTDEREVLTMMKNSVLSLYEVREIFPDKGLLLGDLILGDEYDVREKAATAALSKWDILCTRLQHVDGQYIMSGAVYAFPIKLKDAILGDIIFEYERYREYKPDANMQDFLKEHGEHFNFCWYNLIQNPPKIQLATTDGEHFVISRAHFQLNEKDAVVKQLRNIKGFEEEESELLWFGSEDKEGSATVLVFCPINN